MNFIRNARKINRSGRNAYAKSELEPILPDFPYWEGSNGRSKNSGSLGRASGVTRKGTKK